MRVIRFVPSQPDADKLGLTEFRMHSLGQVVVLAGPNGGGKTRTLSLLQDSLGVLRQNYQGTTAGLQSNIQTYEQALAGRSHAKETRKQYQTYIDQHQRILAIRQNLELSSDDHGQISVASFSTVANGFTDPQSTHRAQLKNSYDSAVTVLGTGKLKKDALAYIDYVATRRWNARDPATAATEGDRQAAIEAWEELERLVKALLAGATLGRNVDGVVLINGRPGASDLSDGQKALLVAATTFHAQQAKLEETIVLVDEPETHLHPSAQIEFIERLIQVTTKGQVWIATHSVHILSHVHPSSLWFVDSGTIAWAGKKPEVVISTLVGDDERVGRLERFLQLPAVFGMERFVAECLSAPTIVSTGAEDSQSTQIREIILRVSKGSTLRVLDYGAGKGRILAALRVGTEEGLATKIDYRAYERDEAARTECVAAIAEAYEISPAEAAGRVYGDEGSLRSHLNRGSVDVVVMCNVLHEIEPIAWPSLFTDLIRYCLRDEGYLLIVEDMHIPHGEHAHKHGFILLDAEQLQELFDVDRENLQQFRSYGKERLKAHLVRADVLPNVSAATVREALIRRRKSAMDEIQRIRNEEPSFANGRLLGLYAMLHANASLALGEP